MKVLVTGGAGFLGGRIVTRLLERGHDVAVFARSVGADTVAAGARPVSGDLRNADAVREACRGMDAVFHVAAKAGVWGSRRKYFGINLDGTRNVIAGCRVAEVPFLVYTSTPSVVFGSRPLEGADESTPYPERFLTHYAHSKALAEQAVLAADAEGGLRTVALRPHLIWGKGDPHLAPRVLERARAGKLKRVGGGRNRVDITHVEDAAAAHLLALDKLAAGPKAVEAHCAYPGGRAYFVSSEAVALWDWIRDLLERAGLPAITDSVSHRTARAAGRVFEALYSFLKLRREPPMTRFVADNLSLSHWFDLGRARRDLGYEPQWDTERGFAELFAKQSPAAKAVAEAMNTKAQNTAEAEMPEAMQEISSHG